jgi:Type II intron maturase/Reverse transcriptase (RNA-dependent DNA polymerase)
MEHKQINKRIQPSIPKYTKTHPQNENINKNLETTSITDIKMLATETINIFKDIQPLIPDGRIKQTIKKNIKKLEESQPTPEEIEINSIYDNGKKYLGKKIEDYSETQKQIIKSMNARSATYGRTHRNIIKLITENNLHKEAIESYLKYKQIIEKQQKQSQLKLTIDPSKKLIDFRYYRYADDWILFLRGPMSTAKTLKKILELWLKNNLKLQLSPEKTLITNIKENKAHFLGFEIFHQINKKRVRRHTQKGSFLQRYGKIQIMPDSERLTNRFKLRNYTNQTGNKILSIGFLTPLEDHQIIQKFNEFIMGLGLYYITEISRPSAINKWHYILYYSCLKTLAHKHRISIRKIINTGYKDISDPNINQSKKLTGYQRRIIRSYRKQDGEKKYITLLNYQEMMMKLHKTRNKYRKNDPNTRFNSPIIDFLRLHKNNWRTKFKLNTMCAICASTESLELHHINPIKKSKTKGKMFNRFDQMVGSLGRKQICLCRTCHEKVTHGQYNNISPKELIDIRIVAPEGILKTGLPNNNPTKTIESQIKSQTQAQIKIDDINKTYFNSELYDYYKRKSEERYQDTTETNETIRYVIPQS